MVRWLAMIAALLVTAVACGRGEAAQSSAAPADFWAAAPQNTAQYWSVYERARAIDPCALLPRAGLAPLGAVRTVAVKGLDSCAAELDSDQPRGVVRVDLRVLAGTVDELGARVGTTKHFDGATALVIADKDTRADKQVPPTGDRACTVNTKFPAHAGFSISVTVPRGIEPCPAAEAVSRTAVAAWKQQPRQEDSIPTVRTVLTGADPCAVTPRLAATVDPDKQQLYACALPYGGTEFALLYEYQSQRALEAGEPVLIADHTVYRHEGNGSPYLEVQVGPAYADGEDGPLAPAVWLGGKDESSLVQIMYQVLQLFPN
ncbi:hypothetical protein [Nocardia panacis]|nr:hypothetical protein [Nocardia panacis]